MKTSERIVVVALCALVGWFYVWTARSSGDKWKFGQEQRDYYNLLIDGYLDGQLHMKVEVPQALLDLKDPYDPGQRPLGLGLHDASFYRGKYYVYFGAAPMIVLMLPFRLITGVDLPLVVAVLIYVYGGFLASVAVGLALRRRYFPAAGLLTLALGILVLGFAGVSLVLLRRPHMWELPIAGGYCFAMLALLALWRAVHAPPERRSRWLAAAALALGLAVASRPTYLVATPCLLVPLAVVAWRERRMPWHGSAAVVVPLACVGALMAWHNYARFGNPLQFGQAYQFSLDYESKLPHFGASYVPYNARTYFFSSAEWSRYFPFIRPREPGPAPKGFTIHRGDVYGLLANFPIAWLAFAAPLALWRRPRAERAVLGTWLAAAAVLFAANALLLLSFFSALARYQMDFAPALLVLSVVGLFAVERWLAECVRVGVRAIGLILLAGAAGFSAAFGVLFSLQFDGLLRERNPRLERVVAKTLNRIPATFEPLFGVHYGPVALAVRLPADIRAGKATLLSVDAGARVQRVFIEEEPDGRVRLGLALPGTPELRSRALPLERNVEHRVVVTWGALFPPVTHPYFAGRSEAEVRRLTREVRIDVDDEPVVLGHQRRALATATAVRTGIDAVTDAAYPAFRGTVGVGRRTTTPVSAEESRLFARVRFSLPREESSAWQPLLSVGEGVNAAVLAIQPVSGHGSVAAWITRGETTLLANGWALARERAHEVVVRVVAHGSGEQRLQLWIDGELASARRSTWRGEASSVIAGRNPHAVEGCAEAYAGEVFSLQTGAAGEDPLVGRGDTVRLRVRLPANRPPGREPLVVTGRSGGGDMLMIEYPDPDTVRFAVDHWGAPLQTSAPVHWPKEGAHDLEITMTSLQPFEDASLVREVRWGAAEVKLDGKSVWRIEGDFYAAEPVELALGRNPIGGTSCGPVFTGDVLAAERVRRD